jgi:flagellar biosynthesis protein FlhF
MAQAIVADAQRELAPFDPDMPLRTLARRTLAQRLTVKHGVRAKHRTIALVGPPGAGKTLAAAKLCNAFATSGREVAAISLEPARKAMRLVMFTDMVDVNLEIADAPKLIQHARERTADAAIVIADTPAIDARKRTSFTKLARLLTALEPDETHLVLPADWSVEDGRALLDAARDTLPINRMLITHADRPAPTGLAVGLSLAAKLPVSYISESAFSTGGIRPADPKQLARLVL